MTPQLTPEMRQALAAHPGQPLFVEDAATKATYVLISEAAFQKVQPLIYDDSEPDVTEFLPLAHEALAVDWDAPGMEAYDDYDAHRKKT